ncbi:MULTISPECIES: oxidoreductase [unclassified Pseudoclavibacter]|uniref:oxidoreductase n=1 Tax=unclassified Pseudoclavibacter TaxID=2615177 RepID=UPI001BA6C097|nr:MULTISPECIES: oxidoreductase [unclassified Pseudoclavibacter]MBS3180425.1 oxidoreductase [Pseudoclavibacter sp. Marseille-Q4354]
MSNQNTFLLGGDLPIRRLGYGAMRLAANGFSGPARDAETSREVLRQAIAAGVDHIDTADFYVSDDGALSANTLIREALHPYRDDLVIATKVGPQRTPGGGVEMTTDPSALRQMVETNLENLGLERLDLVYLRLGAPEESAAARFEALAAMRDEGLIRHLGLSNAGTAHLHEALTVAPVAAVQNHFVATQRDDLEVLAACEEVGIAFVPFFPLGGGFSDITDDRLTTVAARHEATTAQIALAWLLARSPVTLAIPGTGSPAHLAENMAADAITLTAEDLADLA